MNRSIINGCSGYGALELKTTYQRNMLLGNFVTFLMVACVVMGTYAYRALQPEMVVIDLPPIDHDLGRVTPILPPTVIKAPPSKQVVAEMKQKPKVGIPKGVADDEVIDDSFMAPTRQDLEFIVSSLGQEVDGLGDNYSLIVDQDEPDWPEQNEFVYVEKQPEFVLFAEPEFPRMAKLAGIGGKVHVKALIDTDGNVHEVIILLSSNEVFNHAAERAAFKCKFTPALQNNMPVPIWVTFAYEFIMTDN